MAPAKWYNRAGLWVFIAALLARGLVLWRFSGSPHFGVQAGDMRFYHEWAVRISQGELSDGQAFYGLPGYAYLLGGLYALFGMKSGLVVALGLQALAEATTAWLIFRLARDVIAQADPLAAQGRGAVAGALAAAAVWILLTPAQTLAVVLMPTSLVLCGFWWCVSIAARPRPERLPWKYLGLGVFIGVLAMGVATILFATVLLLARIVLDGRGRWRGAVASAALLLAGVGVGTSPAWIHNYFVAREPVFLSAHGGINFWIGNYPQANGYPKIPDNLRAGQEELLKDSITVAEAEEKRHLTRAEVSKYWSAKAKAAIAADPWRWGGLLVRKVRNFWSAVEYDDITMVALLEEEGALLPGLPFGLAAALGLAGLLWCWRDPTARWVAAAVLLHMAALMPVFITERYRLAAAPGLLVLGAGGFAALCARGREKQWPAFGLQAATLVASCVFVFWPRPDERGATMEPLNLAISELEVGQVRRAQAHLEEAFALNPNDPAVLFNLGNLWLRRGDSTKAKQFLRRAVEVNPRYAEAWVNLGILAFGEKHPDLALKFLESARAADFGDATIPFLMARAHEAQGNLEAARKAADEAIRLRPKDAGFREFRAKLGP